MKSKKIISLILAVAFIFTLIPATVIPTSASASPALKWVEDEMARIQKLYDKELEKAVEGLTNLSKIDIFLQCEPPKKFSLKSAIIDEGVGMLLGELLGDIYTFFDYTSTIKGIVKPDDFPDNMVYTIQSFARADLRKLQSMVSQGLVEEHKVEFIEGTSVGNVIRRNGETVWTVGQNKISFTYENVIEALEIAERIYNYIQSLFSNFNYQNANYTLIDYARELQKVNLFVLSEYRAPLNILNSAKSSMESKVDNKKVEQFKSDFNSFNKKYGKFLSGAGILPKLPHGNAGMFDVKTYTGESFFSLQFLNYDPLRVLTLESKTRRAGDLSKLIGTTIPLGGVISSAYNSLDDNAKGNIMMSIALPNVFYQEVAVKQRNETFFKCYERGQSLLYIEKLIEEANKNPNSNIYPAILQGLSNATFDANSNYMEENLDVGFIAVEMAKTVYYEVMAADLFALVLCNDTAGRNDRYIKQIYMQADETREWLWSTGLMKSSSFRNARVEQGETFLAFSKDRFFHAYDWNDEYKMETMNEARKKYIDTLVAIVDLSMDNNQLDKTAKGGSKVDFMTPLGKDGNKIYYDQKTVFDGRKLVLKAIETESTKSDKPRYVCYYDITQSPVFVKDMKTGDYLYGMHGMLSERPLSDGTYALVRSYPIIVESNNEDVMIKEINAWNAVRTDIGVKGDGDVTRALDSARSKK